MDLEKRIKTDFLIAYKAKEMKKKDFLGLLLSDIKSESLKPNGKSPETVLKSMSKGLDLAGTEESLIEKVWLEQYLPKTLSVDETVILVNQYFHDADSQLKNIGSVMKYFKSMSVENNVNVDMKTVMSLSKNKISELS